MGLFVGNSLAAAREIVLDTRAPIQDHNVRQTSKSVFRFSQWYAVLPRTKEASTASKRHFPKRGGAGNGLPERFSGMRFLGGKCLSKARTAIPLATVA
jgi:hypothetical protein